MSWGTSSTGSTPSTRSSSRGSLGKSRFGVAATPRAIITDKFADLLTPVADGTVTTVGNNTVQGRRSKADVEAENLRLREAISELAAQQVSLKALGFWTAPDQVDVPAPEPKVTVKSCWGDSLNCGVQELKAERKEKEAAAALKSKLYQEQVAANKERAAIKLELQAMGAEDINTITNKCGQGYKKLGKRAACLKLLRE
jgi:hypothetical protein